MKLKVFDGGFGKELVRGWELWLSGEKVKAVDKWREGMAAGDPHCFDKMVWAHRAGVGAERDENLARQLAERSRSFPWRVAPSRKKTVRVRYKKQKVMDTFWQELPEFYELVLDMDNPEVFVFNSGYGGKKENGEYVSFPQEVRTDAVRCYCSSEASDIHDDVAEWTLSNVPEDEFPNAKGIYWPFCALTVGRPWDTPFFSRPRKIPAKTKASDKSKFCAFFCSHDTDVRTMLVWALSTYKRVDVFGGSKFSNMPSVKKYGDGRNFKPMEILSEYKFVLAAENCRRRGYLTEKLPEAMVSGGVPIYWGDPDVALSFNPRRFVNVSDHDCLDKMVDWVVALDRDDSRYNAMTSEHPFGDWLPPVWFGTGRKVRMGFEIFGSPYA